MMILCSEINQTKKRKPFRCTIPLGDFEFQLMGIFYVKLKLLCFLK